MKGLSHSPYITLRLAAHWLPVKSESQQTSSLTRSSPARIPGRQVRMASSMAT